MKVYTTGVIYQDIRFLKEHLERMRNVDDYSVCTVDNCDRLVVESHYPQDISLRYRRVYTFHRVKSMRDAHNLAGRQLSNYWFCGGHYEADVLNYLHSRIRGG
jgi:hypothetical protein